MTCGHTFKMQLSFIYTISPSAIENDLDLPQAPPEFRRHVYPSGPPKPEPDPNQYSMFGQGDDDEAQPPPAIRAA